MSDDRSAGSPDEVIPVAPKSGVYLFSGDDILCVRAIQSFEASVEVPRHLHRTILRRSIEGWSPAPCSASPPAAAPVPTPPVLDPAPRRRRVPGWARAALGVSTAAALVALSPVRAHWLQLSGSATPPVVASEGGHDAVAPENAAPAVGMRRGARPVPERGEPWTAGRDTTPPPTEEDARRPARPRGDTRVEPRTDRPATPALPSSSRPAVVAPAAPAEAARMLGAARSAYAVGAPARALETLRACGTACLQGPLQEDALALKVQALAANGNAIAAAVLGEHFLAEFPGSPYVSEIRGIVESPRPNDEAWLALDEGATAAPEASYGARPWDVLREPEPGERPRPVAWDIESAAYVTGNVLVVALVGDSPGAAAARRSERLLVLHSPAGEVLDVDPVDAPSSAMP